jgi:hypothetical protein
MEANVVFARCGRTSSPRSMTLMTKIVCTLRADPVDAAHSIFRTATRTIATDAEARRKFRHYWSLLSPGFIVIRWMALGPLQAEAERPATAERERNSVRSTG